MLLNLDKKPSDSIAVIDSEGNIITYNEIVTLADKLKSDFPKKQLCFLLVENSAKAVATIMAMLCSNTITPLILNSKIDNSLLENLLTTYKPQLMCSSVDNYEISRTQYDDCEINPELSHLLPTSGSTGSPKLIRHKYSNIEASALNISTFFELTSTDRPLLVLPLYYTMGLSVVFSHFLVGATVLVTGQSMTSPRFWQFMKEERATSFTGVPYSYQILDAMRFTRMKLPELTLLTQGGGKMPTELNERFANYCQQTGKRWIATYGQSECTARMAWLPPKWAIEKMGSIGMAVPNTELSLIDKDGNTITEMEAEGEMCFRGKNVTMGYATQRTDLAKGDEWNGFIHTGDMARRDADGCYYIIGRLSRFLKLYGVRVGLDECEQIIQNAIKTECACTGTDKKMIIYMTDQSVLATAQQIIAEKTKLPLTCIEARYISEIPKNEAGKKMYKDLSAI